MPPIDRVTKVCRGAVLYTVEIALLGFPLFHLTFGFVPFAPVGILNAPDQLITLTGDDVQIVVGELAPLFRYFSLQLFPVAFDTIPVHGFLQ